MDAHRQQRYYKINEMLMRSIGQWPYQTRKASRAFFTLLLVLCTSQIVPQIMAGIKYRNDPQIFLECVSPFIFILVCLTKLVTCIVNSKKMLALLNRIEEDWKIWARDREVRVLHEYAETGRKMATAYAVAIYSTGILFMTQPVLPKIIDVLLYNGSQPGEFPVPVYYHRIDQQKYYFCIIGYTYVCVSMIIVINIAGDTMFIVYVQHCCGIFAALGFARLIESTYSGCFFFVVGFNMIIMSVTALQIITRTNEPQDTIRFVAFVGAQMIHLFIESYISQILMDHSTSIRSCIQNGKWYRVSIKSQKLISLMMMRSNVPCRVTAGKICVMSVETFGVVLKTSVSYFTLLRSMQ